MFASRLQLAEARGEDAGARGGNHCRRVREPLRLRRTCARDRGRPSIELRDATVPIVGADIVDDRHTGAHHAAAVDAGEMRRPQRLPLARPRERDQCPADASQSPTIAHSHGRIGATVARRVSVLA